MERAAENTVRKRCTLRRAYRRTDGCGRSPKPFLRSLWPIGSAFGCDLRRVRVKRPQPGLQGGQGGIAVVRELLG